MLNEGRRTELLFFLREIVLESGVSEKEAEPFLASLTAKGSRESVESATDFWTQGLKKDLSVRTYAPQSKA